MKTGSAKKPESGAVSGRRPGGLRPDCVSASRHWQAESSAVAATLPLVVVYVYH